MKFLSDYNDIIERYRLKCEAAHKRMEAEYGVACQVEKEEAASKMGLSVEEFEVEKEKFWSDVKMHQPQNFWWSVRILLLFYKERMEISSFVDSYANWKLPNGYVLNYDDDSHSWSLYTGGSILTRRLLVNSVYCRKGLLYRFVCNFLRKKSAGIRNVRDWRRLDELSDLKIYKASEFTHILPP